VKDGDTERMSKTCFYSRILLQIMMSSAMELEWWANWIVNKVWWHISSFNTQYMTMGDTDKRNCCRVIKTNYIMLLVQTVFSYASQMSAHNETAQMTLWHIHVKDNISPGEIQTLSFWSASVFVTSLTHLSVAAPSLC